MVLSFPVPVLQELAVPVGIVESVEIVEIVEFAGLEVFAVSIGLSGWPVSFQG